MVERELELGTGTITATDHGTLWACRTVYDLAKENGLTPILGIEGYFRDDSDKILIANNIPKDKDGTFKNYLKYTHITLHATDQPAYDALVRIVSRTDLNRSEVHGSERKPLFDWNDLEELGAYNITCGSGCLVGMVSRHLVDHDNAKIAMAYYDKLKAIFKKGNFYVEVFPHKCDKNWVDAVMIECEGQKLQYWDGKKLKTETGEITAIELANSWGNAAKRKQHTLLFATKNYSTWDNFEKPIKILNVAKVADYLPNECRPWMPDGDPQKGCNRFLIYLAKKNKDLVVLSDDCVAKDTLIRTEFGYKPIQEIVPGDKVISHKGNLCNVLETRGLFTDKKILKLSGKGFSVSLTEDHKVWTRKDCTYKEEKTIIFKETSIPKWTEAKTIVSGDFVFCPAANTTYLKEEKVKIDLGDYFTHNSIKQVRINEEDIETENPIWKKTTKIKRFLTIEEDEAFLIGFFLGDGNAHNNLTSFAISRNEYEHCSKIILRVIEKYGFNYDLKEFPGYFLLRIINTAFTQFMRKNFYCNKTKTIPNWIYSLSDDLIKQIIGGTLWADGSDNGNQYQLTLSMTALQPISFIREFLLRKGFYTNITSRQTTGATMPLYTLYFPRETYGFLALWNIIPVERTNVAIPRSDNGFWIKINKIEEIKEKFPVYDLEIDGDHSFSTLAIAVHNCHFADPSYKRVQDVRLMQEGRNSWRFYNSYHRFDSKEAYEHFKNTLNISGKEFEGWVENNINWASRFKDFKLEYPISLPTKFYPQDTIRHTLALINKHGRMKWNNKIYTDRLQKEIEVLYKNGKVDLLPYFMVVEEVCDLYKKNEQLTSAGRGSAAGCLLSYLLGITHVDPIKNDLQFARFITLSRIRSSKMPDIDMDFSDRNLLVGEDGQGGWLKERFGDHFAQISNVSTLKLRNAIKDVSRVIQGKVSPEIEAITKKLPVPQQGLDELSFINGYEGTEGWVPGIKDTNETLKDFIKKYPEIWDITQKALSLPRQYSKHASAFLISNSPIYESVPLTKINGVTCTQYNGASVEANGGLKMDFLIVKSLRDIQSAIKLIQERYQFKYNDKIPKYRQLPYNNEGYDVWDLPEIPEVYNDICEGKVETVFQLCTQSAGIGLKNFNYNKPNSDKKLISSIFDLSVFVALDRPGPLDLLVEINGSKHNLLVEYARRAKGEEHAVTPEIFNKMLPETQGIMIFQEQITKIYQELTGCTLDEAETFRNNISKKKKEKIVQAYPFYLERASKKIGEEKAIKAWQAIETFANYGFNKNHSFSYSLTSYACAFLKHYYPLEWWCAVLNGSERNKIVEQHWKYCNKFVLMPDVKNSKKDYYIIGDKIQAPLSLLDGIGEQAQKQIALYAPYENIKDFCNKIQLFKETNKKENGKLGHSAVNRRVLYSLISSGICDSLFPEGLSILDKLELFETNLKEATGQKAQKVSEEFNLDALGVYYLRKSILPVYSDDLRKLIKTDKIVKVGDNYLYNFKSKNLTVISGEELQKLEHLKMPIGSLHTAAIGFVTKQRVFKYANNTKEACAITIDVDGFIFEYVKWPKDDGILMKDFKKNLLKNVILVVLYKRDTNRAFNLEKIEILAKEKCDE